ncbi:MAG: hypothetical protein DCC49_09795 [Acidobacteria bacterium]|nr:MAG: hypothetical protein DCC49_09795 [Acidobacteriota bacterium]
MECPTCGAGNREGAVFCSSCGAALGGTEPPTSELVAGRYRLGDLIGEGGMKTVHLAHDETLDTDVALAFFKAETMSAEDMARVDREVKAMVALGGHPAIMRIADFGEHEGRRFIVTPLMNSGDLADRLRETGQLELDELLNLAKALAGALDFAHSKGVIHRDIKPENIWFDPDGRPYLGDFGLAVAVDESRITKDGTVLGTPAYLAPECASGGLEAGPMSDLYSLGVLLYECAVGHPPFRGSLAEVVSQHMSVEPVAPKVYRPDLPAGVEALILALLAKSPERRPASAEVLGEAIDELIAARAGHTTAEAGVRRERFIGRSSELSRAREAVDSAAAGRATFLTVAGDPGIGKTRLAEEVIAYAELRGFTNAIGNCLEDEGAPAFWPWQQALRSLVEKCDGNEIRNALGASGPVLARILPEVSAVIPEVEPAPTPADPGQARFQLFDAIAAFLRRLSSFRPLMVLLEDIHWADEPSLKLLQFIASTSDRERQLIVGTYRDVELGRHHPLSGAMAELAKSDRAIRISLSGLEHDEIVEMVRSLGGGEVSEGLVGEIESRTEGNPFFIAEVIRLASESAGGSWEFTVPQGVREVLGHRLNQLDEETNRILAMAAVIGREFQLSLLEHAAGGMAVDVLAAIVAAEEAGLIAELAEREGVYAFSHALVRETLYQELSTARRAMLHRKVAGAIEVMHEGRLELHLAELAHHLLKSSAPDAAARAVEFFLDAGNYSLSVFAYEDAVKNCETALEAIELAGLEGGEEECRALTLLGDALWRQREGDKASEYLKRALGIARRIGRWDDFARALLLIPGRTAGFGFVMDAIDDLVLEAIGNLGEGETVLRSRLLSLRVSSMAHIDGDIRSICAERAQTAEEALRLADDTGDAVARLEARAACAIHIASPDRTAERKEWIEGIIEISTECGDWDGVIQGLMLRIATHYEMAETAEARAGIESMAEIVNSDKPLARRWMLNIIRGLDAQLTGRFKEAEGFVAANMRLGKASDPHEGLKTIAIVALTNVLLAAQGRQKEIAILYAAGARGYKSSTLLRGPVAPLIDIYAQAGEAEKAREWLDALSKQDYFIESDHQWLSNMSYLASACSKLQDLGAAKVVYERLSPHANRFAVIGSGVACLGSTHRPLGQLATTLGNADLARLHFESGIDANAAAGARPFEAHCHRELAEVLSRTGSGPRGDVIAHLDEAVRLYDECGMDYWKGEAEALRR